MKIFAASCMLFIFFSFTHIPVDAKPQMLSLQLKDRGGKPIVQMRTETLLNGKTIQGITDKEGFLHLPVETGFPLDLKVITRFEYILGDKPAFVLGVLDEQGVLMHVKNTYDIKVNGLDDLHQEVVIQSTDIANKRYNDQLITVYQYLSDSVYFYDQVLSAYDEFDIPTFYGACYATPESTFYFDNIAVVSELDMPVNNENAPQNREWHEYNHHILFNLHKKWPQAPSGYEKNHAGFLNTTTSDSYVEGFAEFMSLMVGEFTGYPYKDVYRPIGSMELDYIPVDYAGMAEEFAIAGVLWDLYDGINDDPVQLSIDEIWEVLSKFNNDFTDVYDKLIARHPDIKNDIDQTFVNHGFFVNMEQGNGRWDFGEPYVGWPERYRPGDYFIDLPTVNGKIVFAYQRGEKIGSAGDISRPYRRTTMAPAGHCIKTKNKSVCYTVDVEFDNEPDRNFSMKINNVNGEIKFAIPPERYASTVTVKPDGLECKKALTIRSQEFYEKYQKSVKNKFFVHHDFAPLTDESTEEPVSYKFYSDPETDEAVVDEKGNKVTVFVEQKAPKPITDPLNGMLIPMVVVFFFVWLMFRKKPK